MVSSPVMPKLAVASDEAPLLRPFFEKIIDKKVNGVALTIFERIVHSLCSYFYSPYKARLDYRTLKSLDIDENLSHPVPQPVVQATAQKVHQFADGTPLYDRTSAQRVAISQEQGIDLLIKRPLGLFDKIVIDGKPVYFSDNPQITIVFGKNYHTKEVIVTDVKECPELVIIYEREDNHQLKAWCVDTTQPSKKIINGGQLTISETDILIAQEIAPKLPPRPMIVAIP